MTNVIKRTFIFKTTKYCNELQQKDNKSTNYEIVPTKLQSIKQPNSTQNVCIRNKT